MAAEIDICQRLYKDFCCHFFKFVYTVNIRKYLGIGFPVIIFNSFTAFLPEHPKGKIRYGFTILYIAESDGGQCK